MSKNDDILRQARLRFNAARKADKKERLLAEEDTRFAINDEGCQWDKATREVRERANPPRPCLVMNKTAEKIAQTEGEFKKLKPSITVKAVDSKADPKIANIISSIIRNIEYNSNARAAYNTAHACVLNGGRGFWRINIVDSVDDPFEQDIEIDRIPNPLSVTFDPSAKKVDKSDAKYFFISEDVPIETFKKQYPKCEIDEWPDDDSYTAWKREDSVRIAEYWWKEDGTKTAYRVERDGLEQTVWELLPGETAIAEKKVNHPKIRWCKMVAGEILEGIFDDWPGKYLPLISEMGIETNINGEQKTRGMVRFVKDPQQMYNYWTTAEAEQIQAVREPYLMTPAMMGKHQKQWDESSTRNFKYLFYEADPKIPGATPRRENPQQVSTAMLAAKQGMEHDIMSAMNVYRASLGDEGSEISGKAIIARTAQSNISGYNFTDMFEHALIYSAKVLIDIIPHVYDTERILRIRGEDESERLVPINSRPNSPMLNQVKDLDDEFLVQSEHSDYINDIGIGKYDVVATIGPAYTTQREEALSTLVKVLEMMPNLAAAAPDLVVGLLDIPMSEELLKRARKLVPPGIRSLEPGEEPPKPPAPSIEEQVELKKLELEGIKTMIAGFDSKIDAIAKLMTAEAKEKGQQLQEVSAFVAALKEQEQMRMGGNNGNNSPIG